MKRFMVLSCCLPYGLCIADTIVTIRVFVNPTSFPSRPLFTIHWPSNRNKEKENK